MTNTQAEPTRRPGRPSSRQALDSRQALINAARELFARHDFDQISTKRIAEAAGVNPAMIQYHFRSKTGLLEATFRETLDPVIEELKALSARGIADRFDVQALVSLYMGTMAAQPWLPKMILRHVLPEGGHLQTPMVQKISAEIAPALRQLIVRSQHRNELRDNLDPLLTTISFVSLALFPFVGLALIQRVFEIEPNEAFVDQLIEHTANLFSQGAGSNADVD